MIPSQTHFRRLLLSVIVLFVIFIGLLWLAIWEHSIVTRWDLSISGWVIARTTPTGDEVVSTLSALGEYQMVKIATILVGLFLLFHRDWRRLVMLGALFIAAAFLTSPLKDWAARSRPPFAQDFLYGNDFSFPSGHATMAAAFYGMTAYLGWQYAHPTWLKWGLAAVSCIVVFLVGLSRVYLGAHYLTDVLGGWILGGWLLCGVWLAGDFLFRRYLSRDGERSNH